jgi:hypothetical protein
MGRLAADERSLEKMGVKFGNLDNDAQGAVFALLTPKARATLATVSRSFRNLDRKRAEFFEKIFKEYSQKVYSPSMIKATNAAFFEQIKPLENSVERKYGRLEKSAFRRFAIDFKAKYPTMINFENTHDYLTKARSMYEQKAKYFINKYQK